MVTIIKKGLAKSKRESLLKKAMSKKGDKVMDGNKFCGTVNFKEDAVVLQNRWRDEWQ